ncbi:MAG: ABC transporter permease [Vicinamibacterales bacterium]
MLDDLRHALRFLVRNPGFAAATVATLALGIGANSAMFSVVRQVLLRPLPYPEPQRLVKLWEYYDGNRNVIAPANYFDWIARSGSFETTAAFVPEAVNLSALGDAERLEAARVSTAFFDVLKAAPLAGRAFVAADEASGPSIVMIRESFWRTRLAADPAAIGRTIRLDGDTFEIVGIVPDRVEQPSRDTQLWRVLRVPDAQKVTRGAHYLQAIGRLAPGVTITQAHEELSAIGRDLAQQHPATNARVGAAVFGLQDDQVRSNRSTLWTIFAATAVLLLLACVNVAHLLLARSAARRTEIAVRAALGATRARIARQLIAESLVLAVVGGAAGLLIAMWTTMAVRSVVPASLEEVRRATVDAGVLLFTGGTAILTALLFGAVPALRLSGIPLAQVARAQSTNVSTRTGTGRLLIVLQVALAVVLVVGAGLLLGSFSRLQSVDPGFDTTNLVVARIALPQQTYPDGPSHRRFFRELLDRLQATGGIDTVAAATRIPLRSQSANMTFTVDSRPEKDLNGVIVQEMSPELVKALRLRVVMGRSLEEIDATQENAVLVSRSFATRTWGDENVLGRKLRMGPTYINEGQAWLTVVGVIDDVRQYQLGSRSAPQVYLPYGQTQAWAPSEIVVRSALPPATVVNAIRATVKALDANQPVTSVYTMKEVMAQSVAKPRFNALLVGAFAALALLLAVIGIYGVLSYAVSQRRREMGVRVALGATRGDVLRLIAGDGLTVVGTGLVVGLAASAVLTRWLEGMLFGVKPLDLPTYATAALIMSLASLAACVVPTLRATRLDPANVLRAQ